MAICGMDYFKKQNKMWLSVFPFAFSCMIAYIIKCDYSYIGVATVVMFWLFSRKKVYMALTLLFLSLWNFISYGLYTLIPVLGKIPVIISTSMPKKIQIFQAVREFALIPIFMYNGKYGPEIKSEKVQKAVKYGFYAFYPAHLLVLYVIARMI